MNQQPERAEGAAGSTERLLEAEYLKRGIVGSRGGPLLLGFPALATIQHELSDYIKPRFRRFPDLGNAIPEPRIRTICAEVLPALMLADVDPRGRHRGASVAKE